MYYSHTTTTIALRAKWSIIHCNDFGFGAQSNPGATCTACSQSSLYVSSRNPRFSYHGHLLKKSPIFCQLPRRVVTFRVCEENEPFCKSRCFVNNGFHVNFFEKDENCNRIRRNLTKGSAYFDDFEDSGDEYRKYYKKERLSSERRNSVVKSGDGKKEVHNFRRHEDGRKFVKHLNNEANREDYCREVRDEDRSTVSGNNSSSSRDYADRRVENVRKYANSGDGFSRDARNDRSRRVSDRRYRDEEEIFLDKRERTRNKKISTLSIDFENDRKNYSSKKNSNLLSNVEGRRIVGDNKGYEIGNADEEEMVVQEIQKNIDNEASFRSGPRKETKMEDFDRKTTVGDEKTTYSFRKGLDRNEDYVYNKQEESRKLIKSQKDNRYNRSRIVESIDDRRRESFLHSQHDSDMRYMDKGESSKSILERQSEIDKQAKSQTNIIKSSLRSDNGVNKATSLTSVKNSICATRDGRTQIDESEFDKINENTIYGTYNNDYSVHNANTSTSHTDSRREDGIALRSRRHVEDETTRKDSIASSVENQIRRDVVSEMDAMEKYTKQTNASVIYSSGIERVNSGNIHLEMREDMQEEFLTSELDSSVSGIRRNDSERVSNLLEESTIRTKNQQEASSTKFVENNDNKEKWLQSTAQVGTSSSVNQYKNGAIESARRLDESSSMYVGDFVNNLRQEALASDNHEETSTVRQESDNQSSLRYRNKGPSDDLWEMRGTTSMESSKTEEAKNNSSNSEVSNVDTTAEVVHGNIIAKRAHKSLWTYIADIMKVGLGHRSDTSTQKSRRSSSNASASSEAYFSGEELDEDKDGTGKEKSFDRSTHVSHEESDRSNIIIEQPLLPLRRKKSPLLGDTGKENVHGSGSPKSTKELEKQNVAIASERRNELEKTSDPHVGGSTFIPIIRSAFSSRGGDMSQSQQGQGSSTVTTALTPPSVPEIESVNMPSSGIPKLEETANNEESERGTNRRKLQRSKQVMTTQFEEWEEAYKREREQRLVDELFMREALLEAKKAADSWEVPVGAVLVQNGKIIARGCNLVEELRDSTAHAEMICIRQASNILKSWRLAETTLYVTLEPCAMCAGAILQARVDTVVWGAPNKLLGADGSWVRLFPNGDEGSSSNLSNSANQNIGPVHPFHPKITIRRGILATECSDTMQQFFQLRRKKKVNKEETPPPPPRMSMSAAPVQLLGRFHNLLAAMFCL